MYDDVGVFLGSLMWGKMHGMSSCRVLVCSWSNGFVTEGRRWWENLREDFEFRGFGFWVCCRELQSEKDLCRFAIHLLGMTTTQEYLLHHVLSLDMVLENL